MTEIPTAHASVLLRELGALLEELHPTLRVPLVPRLDSSLDHDLRLDSLGRSELLLRLERRFGVRLPERLLAEAETPRDLLSALASAPALETSPALVAEPLAAPATLLDDETPGDAENLLDVLRFHARRHPGRIWIHLYGEDSEVELVTYGDLEREAEEVAAGLLAHDLEAGEAVALMLPTGREYFQAFWGILRAGGVPLPLYPPVRPSQLEDHLRRQEGILVNARARLLVTIPEARPLARILGHLCPDLRGVVTTPELRQHGSTPGQVRLRSEQTAFLQYTSGSTGQPKGVVLSHANLLANVSTMGRQIEASSRDVFVSWLPLYHDMGLIGACLGSLYFGFPLALMSPLAFLSRPASWMKAVHRHRGTISAAPNFAYELCLKKIRDEDLEGLDLSSWRLALNGAEPVRASTLRRFAERFAPWGFRSQALFPAYGLAECSVGLAFPETGALFRVDRIDRETLHRDGIAHPVDPSTAVPEDDGGVEIVGCGRAIAGHEIRIVDDASEPLGERQVGRVQFRGPSATSGYFRHPEATAELFDGDWLETRDLGYLADGELFLTGRAKDLVIRAGRNLLPYELEEAVGSVEGVRKGCVAVFGAQNADTGTENLVVLAETRLEGAAAREALRERIAELAMEILATAADDIVLAPPGTVLKTSSGKIRRANCRERYERGELGRGPKRVWHQISRLAFAALLPAAHQVWRAGLDWLWAIWAWTIFLAAALLLWPLMLLVPGERRRQDVARLVARATVRVAGLPVSVEGPMPDEPCIVVANHASYVDAPIVAACLPSGLSWVAKGELARSFWTRLPLERIGVRFVERFDASRSLEDSRKLQELAGRGQTLAFFPEGTFDHRTGLLPFRLGAFRVAVEAGLPVVPVALKGTRQVLRADRWRPLRRPVEIVIGAPLRADGEGFTAVVALRDRTRETLLEVLHTPDLAEIEGGAHQRG